MGNQIVPPRELLSDPSTKYMEGKTMSELHEIIVSLKIKDYKYYLSAAERNQWASARKLYQQGRQNLHHVWGVSSNDILLDHHAIIDVDCTLQKSVVFRQ
jgi:hypothetical protein